jgi:hypothetical protein
MTDVYQLLGKHQQAADTLVNIAHSLDERTNAKPLFFE